jgi:adenosylcobinamide-GDP ribazoletransferase
MKTDLPRRIARDVHLAGVLLTRLPLPQLPQTAFQGGHGAVWAYPLIGAGIAALGSIAGLIALGAGLPPLAAAGIAIAAMTLTTGAMHEDGLADTADGLWGGWTRERRLAIMKDSHIGTYGVLALLLAVGIKCALYAALLPMGTAPIIAAAALSRAMMPIMMRSLPHARQDGLSQSVGRPSPAPVWAALGLAALVALVCSGSAAPFATGAALLGCFGLMHLARIKIGGQTGDILGATQVLCELCALILLCAL